MILAMSFIGNSKKKSSLILFYHGKKPLTIILQFHSCKCEGLFYLYYQRKEYQEKEWLHLQD